MLTFFAITVMLDLHTATDLVLNMIKELQEVFPASVHLRAQRAMVYYHMRGKLSYRVNTHWLIRLTLPRFRSGRKGV